MPRLERMLWLTASIAVGALLIALWQYVANAELISPIFLPSPHLVWQKLVGGILHGELGWQFLATIKRMIYGWVIASLLGIVVGCIIGVSAFARSYLAPTVELIRPLPASAMVPVAISIFGLSDRMVLAVVAFGGLWPMLLATIYGFAAVEPRLIELSRALGMTRLQIIWKISLPSALPDIFTGLRLSLTTALVLAVVGEMLASRAGVGQWILLAGRSFRSGDLFAGVVLLGLLGFVSASLLAWFEHRSLRWRRAG